jgi:hypothetical protein
MPDLSPDEQTVADALRQLLTLPTGDFHIEQDAAARTAVAALDLPARDARVRAEERAKVAEEIAHAIADISTVAMRPDSRGVYPMGGYQSQGYYQGLAVAARIAREHATAPGEETDHG